MNNIKFWHRVRLPDGTYTPGEVMHGPDGGDWPTTRFGMPLDLTGKTVLDIGAWDGFFSFEAEKRGAAKVIATNPRKPKGPDLAGIKYLEKALKSNVRLDILDIEEGPDVHTHDVVLFYGVLYHLKSPLIALENVYKSTAEGGICLLETAMSMKTDSSTPLLEYHPNFDNDKMNFFYPNDAWIRSAAEQVGFTSVELIHSADNRAVYKLIKAEEKVIFDDLIRANTLVDTPRLEVILKQLKAIQFLPGYAAEVGVYKGGTARLIAQNFNKKIVLADTFEGMPEVTELDLHRKGDFADTSVEHVMSVVQADVKILKGLAPKTLIDGLHKDAPFSFVHLDVDIYTSVKECLEYFYPKMVERGVIIIDDYNEPDCPGAKKAVDEFLADKPEKLIETIQSQAMFIKL